MAGELRVGRINQRELRRVADYPQVDKGVREVAEAVAQVARGTAVKRSGRGAASIDVERGYNTEQQVTSYHVAWDRAHFYMSFHNSGTRYISARRFMERAAEQFRSSSRR